ncbi:ATP-binding protein [uncultured Bacteroides sp.]|uniref:ATP-binding protein n=1 Tax=uncultured Bacteroides sp. TaxID=162156 RepID=UPI0025D8A8CC|nr:ATP-binding protein [uncultured Bacteroides sp.]
MNIDNLNIVKELIANMENSQVEFKETTGQLERGMETLCAFLNSKGGTVLFGVTDKGKIIGQDLSDKTKRDIVEAIRKIEPLTVISVSYITIPDTIKYIIALHVESQMYARPFTYKGRAYYRMESVTSVMPQDNYNLLLMQRGGKYGWEAIINEDLKVESLDENAILGAVRTGVASGRLPETTIREDIPLILEKFNLSSNNGKLKNAAAVLFGKDLSDYPQCLLRMARFKGINKEEFIDNQRIYGNIFDLLDAAMAFCFKHLSISGKIEGLYREEELAIPYRALRECCINAFSHRIYHKPGSSVSIAIYDDRVEVTNSGTFPEDMTLERLLNSHDSEPQNPIIANVLYKSKILESWGRGIGLMISECRRVELPDPEFHTDGAFVWVVFRYAQTPDKHPTSTRQASDKHPTSTPQVKSLIELIGENIYSVKEMMGLMQLKDRENFLNNYLNPSMDANLVEPLYPAQPRHPKQKYRLTEKGKTLLKE